MLPFPLFLACKYLRPKRSVISIVSVISVLGVIIGVAILVIVTAVMTGFDNTWRDKILSFKPHLTVVSPYGAIEDEEALCKRLEVIEGVTGVAPSIETRVLLKHDDATASPVVVGIDPDRASTVSKIPYHMRAGKFDLSGDSLLVGVDLARQLGIMPGSKVTVYTARTVMDDDEITLPEDLTVTGIFDMGMRDFDSGFVLTSLDVARDLVGMDSGAYSIYMMTDDPFKFDSYAQRVRKDLGPGYLVRSWSEIDRMLFDALSHEKTMMFVLLVFITIVAIFCITNTLIVIGVQKTSEVGLLKALGFSWWQILLTFVLLGWIQCLIGTAAGVGVALLILNNLEGIVNALLALDIEAFPKGIYGLDKIPWDVQWVDVRRIAIVVMSFCTLASLIPASRAAGLDPVKALRH